MNLFIDHIIPACSLDDTFVFRLWCILFCFSCHTVFYFILFILFIFNLYVNIHCSEVLCSVYACVIKVQCKDILFLFDLFDCFPLFYSNFRQKKGTHLRTFFFNLFLFISLFADRKLDIIFMNVFSQTLVIVFYFYFIFWIVIDCVVPMLVRKKKTKSENTSRQNNDIKVRVRVRVLSLIKKLCYS